MSDSENLRQEEESSGDRGTKEDEIDIRAPRPPLQIAPALWTNLFYIFVGLSLLIALFSLMAGAPLYEVALRSLASLVSFVLIELLFISAVVMPFQARQHARYVVEKRLFAVEVKKRQQEAIQNSFDRGRRTPNRKSVDAVQNEPPAQSTDVEGEAEGSTLSEEETPNIEDQAAGLRRLVTAST